MKAHRCIWCGKMSAHSPDVGCSSRCTVEWTAYKMRLDGKLYVPPPVASVPDEGIYSPSDESREERERRP